MKKYISLLITIFLVLTASCSDQESNIEEKKLAAAKSKYLSENMLNYGSEEFVVLLSIKYNLDIDLTRNIIDEFDLEEDFLDNYLSIIHAQTIEEFEKAKMKMEGPSVQEKVNRISSENNVDQSLIASLLIDYKIWYQSQYDETN